MHLYVKSTESIDFDLTRAQILANELNRRIFESERIGYERNLEARKSERTDSENLENPKFVMNRLRTDSRGFSKFETEEFDFIASPAPKPYNGLNNRIKSS